MTAARYHQKKTGTALALLYKRDGFLQVYQRGERGTRGKYRQRRTEGRGRNHLVIEEYLSIYLDKIFKKRYGDCAKV
ncbi:hypothetical protein HMPREF0262_01137 [Clostridium sp. ATCC 29733]|nr:hypothetical protein HMPREF0262_01137 [Clostridium sp. ATCC 29733]